MENQTILKLCECACGCGEIIEDTDDHGRHRKYLSGHNSKGSNHPMWNGGINYIRGYRQIWNPTHHFRDNRNYVLEHRLVWEQHNNAILLPWADVHHINENKQDNRIENLQAMSHRNHCKHHRLEHFSNES